MNFNENRGGFRRDIRSHAGCQPDSRNEGMDSHLRGNDKYEEEITSSERE